MTESEKKTLKDVNSAAASPVVAPEVQKVQEALERARQTVKPLVKKEAQVEIVTADLLNFRLRA